MIHALLFLFMSTGQEKESFQDYSSSGSESEADREYASAADDSDKEEQTFQDHIFGTIDRCFFQPLYPGASISIFDSYTLVCQSALKHSLTRKAFEELFKLASSSPTTRWSGQNVRIQVEENLRGHLH